MEAPAPGPTTRPPEWLQRMLPPPDSPRPPSMRLLRHPHADREELELKPSLFSVIGYLFFFTLIFGLAAFLAFVFLGAIWNEGTEGALLSLTIVLKGGALLVGLGAILYALVKYWPKHVWFVVGPTHLTIRHRLSRGVEQPLGLGDIEAVVVAGQESGPSDLYTVRIMMRDGKAIFVPRLDLPDRAHALHLAAQLHAAVARRARGNAPAA